jgi:hypothetical protein
MPFEQAIRQPRNVVGGIIPGPIAQRDHASRDKTYVYLVAATVPGRSVAFTIEEGEPAAVKVDRWCNGSKEPGMETLSLDVDAPIGDQEIAAFGEFQAVLSVLLSDAVPSMKPRWHQVVAGDFLADLKDVIERRTARRIYQEINDLLIAKERGSI